MALTILSLADAKTFLGVTVSTEDTTIEALLYSNEAGMESYCRRYLIDTTVTEYLDGCGKVYIFLREPARAITSIYEDGTRAWAVSSLVASSDYQLVTLRNGTGKRVQYYDSAWSAGQANIRVIYSAGFASIPTDVVQAARIQIGRAYAEWKRTEAGKDALAENDVAGWSQTWLAKEGLDPACKQLLGPYRNYGI